jgi:hypothetical protein
MLDDSDVISGRLRGDSDLPLIWRRDALSFCWPQPAEEGKKERKKERKKTRGESS